jgi:hypothetical protein
MSQKLNDTIVDEWRVLLEDCDNRPKTMNLGEWCKTAGVSKSNYYYWKRRIKSLDDGSINDRSPLIVRVDTESLKSEREEYIDIDYKGFKIHVTDRTSMSLLKKVLQVACDA